MITPPEFIEHCPLPEGKGEANREIHALFGLAMYRAQTFELEVINALFFLEFRPGATEKHPSQEQLQAAWEGYYEEQFQHTLGTLIRRLLACSPQFPGSLMALLYEARDSRDRLAHRFYREHDYGWFARERMEKMRDELVAATNLFIRADHALSSFMEPQKAKFGFSEAQVEKLAESIKGRILEGHDE